MNRPDSPIIRPARPEDAEAIDAIYNGFVAECTCTWQTEPDPVETRRARLTHHRAEHPVFVVENTDGGIVAFASLSPYSPRGGFAKTAEVGIYIDDAAQGQGLGSKLMSTLLEAAEKHGLRTLLARISEDQSASIGLHRKFGFVESGRIPDCGEKFGRRLALVYMSRPVDLPRA